MVGLGEAIAAEETGKAIAYGIVVASLIGEIAILALPARRGRLGKILGALFIAIIIVGVAVEHHADNRISGLVAQEETAAAAKIAELGQETVTANLRVAALQDELARQQARPSKGETGTAARLVDDKQRAQIKRSLLPGAHVSILALLRGEPEDFAHALADALAQAGADVSVATGTAPLNGEEGMLLSFNHHNAAAQSVFTALNEAGLGPRDIDDVHGSPVVVIKIGPKQRQF